MGKSSNGEGTISKRKDGRWEARATLGYDHTGKAIRKSYYGATRNEAKQRMEEALVKASVGVIDSKEKDRFYESIKTWYENYLKPNYRPSSIELYDGLLKNYIKPSTIAGCLIKDITSEQIQSFINEVAKTKKDPTIRRLMQLIHGTLQHKADQRIIMINPANFVKKPKAKVEINDDFEDEGVSDRVFTIEEQQKLITHCIHNEPDKKLAAAILISLGSGLRIGEVCGLRDIDYSESEKKLKIKTSLRMINSTLTLQNTKTKSSRRTIPLPDFTIEAIKEYKKYRAAEILKAGPAYNKDSKIFIRTGLGNPTDPRNLRRAYVRLLKRIDLPERDFHALRHTFATNLLESGEQVKVVQELLGHSSPVITMTIYSHVRPNVKETAISKLNKQFSF